MCSIKSCFKIFTKVICAGVYSLLKESLNLGKFLKEQLFYRTPLVAASESIAENVYDQ